MALVELGGAADDDEGDEDAPGVVVVAETPVGDDPAGEVLDAGVVLDGGAPLVEPPVIFPADLQLMEEGIV